MHNQEQSDEQVSQNDGEIDEDAEDNIIQ